jgi:hypothetical protein
LEHDDEVLVCQQVEGGPTWASFCSGGGEVQLNCRCTSKASSGRRLRIAGIVEVDSREDGQPHPAAGRRLDGGSVPNADVIEDRLVVGVYKCGGGSARKEGQYGKPHKLKNGKKKSSEDDDEVLEQAMQVAAWETKALRGKLEHGIQLGKACCPEGHALQVVEIGAGLHEKKLRSCGFCCGAVSQGDLAVACSQWPRCGPPCCRVCAGEHARRSLSWYYAAKCLC